jgi:hypothetical protein
MPDERLRRQVVEAVAHGLLPSKLPSKTWGGFGSGSGCAVCGHTITTEQLETEFEDGDRRPYRLHIQCFAAWEAVARPASLREPALPLALNAEYSPADGYAPKGTG